jgi:hypothetical protein
LTSPKDTMSRFCYEAATGSYYFKLGQQGGL